MTATSTILLPPGSIVCRTASRSKKYAFGVFSPNDVRKPIVFMCGQSESESQTWIGKLRMLIDGNRVSGSIPSNRSFVVSLIENEFSTKLLLNGLYGTLCVKATGIVIHDVSIKQRKICFCWDDLHTIKMIENNENNADANKICTLQMSSWFHGGAGSIQLYCLMATNLIECASVLKANLTEYSQQNSLKLFNQRLSKSEGNLAPVMFKSCQTNFFSGVSISSKLNVKWCDKSDDIQIKDSSLDESGQNKGQIASTLINAAVLLSSSVSQRGAVSSLDLHTTSSNKSNIFGSLMKFNYVSNRWLDRRCSGASIGSGIYEEINENIPVVQRKNLDKSFDKQHDNTYEVVKEPHKRGAEKLSSINKLPPPLPPRQAIICGRLDSTSDSGLEDDSLCSTPSHESAELKWNTIHCSNGSLPRCHTNPSSMGRSKLSGDMDHDKLKGKGSAFSVFRKRIKSDSRVVINKDSKCVPGYSTVMHEAKCSTMPHKKRFDFSVTPSKSINLIKNSRVGRVLRNMKSSGSSLKSNIVNSCEFLNLNDVDEIDSPVGHRCSRSAEHLEINRNILVEGNAERVTHPENDVEKGFDLSLMYENDNLDQAMSHEVFELILKGRRFGPCGPALPQECDYLPMSPRPAALTKKLDEQDYVVMSSPKIANVDTYTSITKAL